MKIGTTIQSLRKKNQLTQAQLAQALQMSRTTIANYENNYSSPDLDTLIALSQYFDVTTDYLLFNEQTKIVSKSKKETATANEEVSRFRYYFDRLNIENQDLIVGEMIKMFKEQK